MSDNNRKNIIIRSTLKQLERDMRDTKDPVRRTILIELLKAKKKEHGDMMIRQITMEQEKSLNVLDIIMVRNDMKKIKKDSIKITDHEKVDKSNQRELLKNKRGSNEDKWEILDENIPAEYSRYIEEDMMNNRLMERLNSEIDFRLNEEDEKENEISKPYDDHKSSDHLIETIDTYAKFNKIPRKF